MPKPARKGDPWKLVIMGDSWAQNYDRNHRTWPQQLGDHFGWPTVNVAACGATLQDVLNQQFDELVRFLSGRDEALDEDAWVVIHAGGNNLMEMVADGIDAELVRSVGLTVLHQPNTVLRRMAKEMRVLVSRLHLSLGIQNLILCGMPLSIDLPIVSLVLNNVVGNGASLSRDDSNNFVVANAGLSELPPLPFGLRSLVSLLLNGLNGAHAQLLRQVAADFSQLVAGGRKWAGKPPKEARVLCVDETGLLNQVTTLGHRPKPHMPRPPTPLITHPGRSPTRHPDPSSNPNPGHSPTRSKGRLDSPRLDPTRLNPTRLDSTPLDSTRLDFDSTRLGLTWLGLT